MRLDGLYRNRRRNTASGFTLVELLVGLAVGAIVLLGVTFSWGLAVRNNAYVLAVTALNNDMRSVMQIVTQDVRRATVEQENDLLINIAPTGDCITFTTAFAQASGAPDQRVPSGYRFFSDADQTSLQVWTGGVPVAGTCADLTDPDWEDLVVSGDRGVILETFEVDFSRSRCLDLDDDNEEFPLVQDINGVISCDAGVSGNRFVQLWLIEIQLAGRLDLAPLPRPFEFMDAVKIRSDSVIN